MPSDEFIYLRVHGDYAHLTRAEAVKRVAEELDSQWSTISGRVTRAHKNPNNRVTLMEYKAQHPNRVTPAQKGINRIVNESLKRIEEHRKRLKPNKLYPVLYSTDEHFPYANWEAIKLLYKVMDHLKPVMYWNGGDGFDFSKMSRHEDKRRLFKQAFDDDVSNSFDLVGLHTSTKQEIVPDALGIWGSGNHDQWLTTKEDKNGVKLVSDTLTLLAMEKLYATGSVFPETFANQPVFRVNEGLAWTHGISASVNVVSRLKQNYKYIRRQLGSHVQTDFVVGHVHKMDYAKHPDMPVAMYQTGCLRDYEAEYARNGVDWTTDITVSWVDMFGSYHETVQVPFVKKANGEYFCTIGGKVI